jgi:hypothetical protein
MYLNCCATAAETIVFLFRMACVECRENDWQVLQEGVYRLFGNRAVLAGTTEEITRWFPEFSPRREDVWSS